MNWLDRFFPKNPTHLGPSVGIGMLVAVVSSADQASAWDDDPVGVVVAPGNKDLSPYPGLQRPRYWTVAFDRPSFTADGRGPFEQASFPEWLLRVLEPGPEASA